MSPKALLALILVWPCLVSAAGPGGDGLEDGMVNPGYHDQPDWFKESFLDIREDVAEAAEASKRVILYFYQDGCPYCAKMLRENFADQDIVRATHEQFDVVAINLWGDREVTGFQGESTTEKAFAAGLKVQYTPTLLLLDEQGRVVLRINGYFAPHKFHAAVDYVGQRREQKGEKFRDFYLARTPQVASGKLHQEPGFLTMPVDLAANRGVSKRPLLVMFEQATCKACDELHQDHLRRADLAKSLTHFDAVILDMWSEQAIKTPDGRELPIKQWATELAVQYAPSLVFFDTNGREVFRTEGYLKSFHVHAVLDYVASGAYRWQPSFQRFIQHRADSLAARGIEYDLMD